MDKENLCEVYIRVKPYMSIKHLPISPMKRQAEWRVSTSPTPNPKSKSRSPSPLPHPHAHPTSIQSSACNKRHAPAPDYDAIKIFNNTQIVIDDVKNLETHSPNTKKKRSYHFDNILDRGSTNQTIYNKLIKPKLGPLFEGNSFTVIAYGISGSGKTHTIFGSPTLGCDYEQGLL
jgi:chromosomal replication initiation ATPase DnaA